jgi:hypothetical protein
LFQIYNENVSLRKCCNDFFAVDFYHQRKNVFCAKLDLDFNFGDIFSRLDTLSLRFFADIDKCDELNYGKLLLFLHAHTHTLTTLFPHTHKRTHTHTHNHTHTNTHTHIHEHTPSKNEPLLSMRRKFYYGIWEKFI